MLRPVPGKLIEEQSEDALACMCLYSEAVGEPSIGKLAVLCVIQNLALRHDTSLREQILKPWAFSGFNDVAVRERMLHAAEKDPAGWAMCVAIFELWQQKGCPVDVTLGADHYYNPDVASPAWGRGHADWEETIVHGHHVFGKCP